MASTRSNARIIRFGIFALILIACGFILTQGSSFNAKSNTATPKAENEQADVPAAEQWSEKDKIKATFVSLARNSDLFALLDSIRQVEDRFNRKFHYDWVFLNDQPFDDAFIEATTALCSGKTKYGLIPKENWGYPAWIDQEKAALTRERMREAKIIYGHSESYRHMCRFESGFFWRQAAMEEYEYYWRVEPDIKIFCDIDYDIFKWMKDNGKEYSFTISLPEYKETIPTLWEETQKYIEANPKVLAENNLLDWISDDKGKTYNGCHFWSNFEIASLNFWRSKEYREYFEHLDRAGGFFYERWGDAPVHSIAAALFLPREKIHFFEDVGYYHVPFTNCPVDPAIRFGRNCHCNPDKDFTWRGWSCTTKYYTINNLKRQKNWEKYT
ncbi:alpha-1,2-mannosyltransferase, partial [Scheffersomyces coipomensis]|uniref:alpha-1,2-mannosyltransferase n=1 Tax=Scheffersomyces coipomensis TaxID=1788519 RepID=UPI00315DF211